MRTHCLHCDGEFIAVFTLTDGQPDPLDACECPHCDKVTRLLYAAEERPASSDFMHTGETVTARTPYAYEWWRHNKEFFVQLRYRPRRVRHDTA